MRKSVRSQFIKNFVFLMINLISVNFANSESLSKKFDDWEFYCVDAASIQISTKNCKINQVLAEKETGQTVFAMSVIPTAKKGSFVAVISTPLGGYLVPGMELSVDKKKPYKILFETCNSFGCHAGFEVKGRISDELSSGKLARFRIWTTKSKPADVSVSLAGFGRALNSLKEAN